MATILSLFGLRSHPHRAASAPYESMILSGQEPCQPDAALPAIAHLTSFGGWPGHTAVNLGRVSGRACHGAPWAFPRSGARWSSGGDPANRRPSSGRTTNAPRRTSQRNSKAQCGKESNCRHGDFQYCEQLCLAVPFRSDSFFKKKICVFRFIHNSSIARSFRIHSAYFSLFIFRMFIGFHWITGSWYMP